VGVATPLPPGKPIYDDTRKPLPKIEVPTPPAPIRVAKFRDDGPPQGSREHEVRVSTTAPLEPSSSAGAEIAPEAIDTVLVHTPDVPPPTSGLSLPDYNMYAASVERGFMDVGCKVVDRQRLEALREEWRLRQSDANAVDPSDTIALGKLLNAKIVVFAEFLGSTTETLRISAPAPRDDEATWMPKVEWVEAWEAEETSVWDIGRHATLTDIEDESSEPEDRWRSSGDNHLVAGERFQLFSREKASLWEYTDAFWSVYAENPNKHVQPGTQRLVEFGRGYRVPGHEKDYCCALRWKYRPPTSGIFPVWPVPPSPGLAVIEVDYAPLSSGSTIPWGSRPSVLWGQTSEQEVEARERAVVTYDRQRLPRRREYALLDEERAVIITEAELRWLRTQVGDELRESAGFVALPVVDSNGVLQYEPRASSSARAERLHAELPVAVIDLTAKIVVVETSQVAWIGTSRLRYTDIMRGNVALPVSPSEIDTSSWPSLDSQQAEILSKVFEFTANAFLTDIAESPR